jgi:hypothetical protein
MQGEFEEPQAQSQAQGQAPIQGGRRRRITTINL